MATERPVLTENVVRKMRLERVEFDDVSFFDDRYSVAPTPCAERKNEGRYNSRKTTRRRSIDDVFFMSVSLGARARRTVEPNANGVTNTNFQTRPVAFVDDRIGQRPAATTLRRLRPARTLAQGQIYTMYIALYVYTLNRRGHSIGDRLWRQERILHSTTISAA